MPGSVEMPEMLMPRTVWARIAGRRRQMYVKLFDSELKVMDVLWKDGDSTAKHIAQVLTESVGWNVNTTYTLIKRCMKKGAIERREPHFMCHALVEKETVQAAETDELIDRVYDGFADKLFAALLQRRKLSPEQIRQLKQVVAEAEKEMQAGGREDMGD